MGGVWGPWNVEEKLIITATSILMMYIWTIWFLSFPKVNANELLMGWSSIDIILPILYVAVVSKMSTQSQWLLGGGLVTERCINSTTGSVAASIPVTTLNRYISRCRKKIGAKCSKSLVFLKTLIWKPEKTAIIFWKIFSSSWYSLLCWPWPWLLHHQSPVPIQLQSLRSSIAAIPPFMVMPILLCITVDLHRIFLQKNSGLS